MSRDDKGCADTLWRSSDNWRHGARTYQSSRYKHPRPEFHTINHIHENQGTLLVPIRPSGRAQLNKKTF